MSDYKFVIYEKLDGDSHTDRMLSKEDHGNVPEEITEKQLNSSRVEEKEVTMEKLLDQKRVGGANVITEKNLNESKGQYGSKFRDASTYEGDINKLEEKRISHKNREDYEYEPASETPKKERWWEVKTQDGLKIAFKKQANLDLDDVDWDYLENRDEFGDRDFMMDDDMDDDLLADNMDYTFDVDEISDLDADDEMGEDGLITEISYNEFDVGGTPTAKGVLSIKNEFYDSPRDPKFVNDLRDFMTVEHGDLSFPERDQEFLSSFDLSDFDRGKIEYTRGTGGDFEINIASTSFPIVEAVIS